MGIKMLSKIIKEKAPNAVRAMKISQYRSNKIAIDASMFIYQFLIAVRSENSTLKYSGSDTSHLSGLFYRTIKLVEKGITPVYVFDGVAPISKIGELQKRTEKREKAGEMLVKAISEGDATEIAKYEKRQVKITTEHIEESKKLLDLMGIPYVTAPSEAEAHCAYLCKRGIVRAVATEDMDALCFGAPVVLRNMNASQYKKVDIEEYNLEKILKGMGLEMDKFIDLCILMGCDFCGTLPNIGPKRGFELIKKYGSIEKIIEKSKIEAPKDFDYLAARKIFNDLGEYGDTGNDFRIQFNKINKDELSEFMVKEKGFDLGRVTSAIERLLASKKKGSQTCLESFFTKT